MARNITYEIKNKGLTILVEQSYDGRGKFEFVGLIKDSEPDIVWTQYGSSFNDGLKGKQLKSLNAHLFRQLKDQADEQLKQYVDKNIANHGFYSKKDDEGKNSFFDKSYENFNNDYPKLEEHLTTDLSDVCEGIIGGLVSNHKFTYDFISHKFTEICTQYNREKEQKTPLQVFYGGKLDKIVAIQQYKNGTAHKAYTELVKLNEFLEGKKSVKLNLKDGKVIEYKTTSSDRSVKAADIIDLFDGAFCVNDSYIMKPRVNRGTPASELEYVQFGKKLYKINIDNLHI